MVRQSATGTLLTCLLLLWSSHAFALDPTLDINQYAHKSWKIREGFLDGIITCIAQTPDGYLWLGTELGLFRSMESEASPGSHPQPSRCPVITFAHYLWRATGLFGSLRWRVFPALRTEG